MNPLAAIRRFTCLPLELFWQDKKVAKFQSILLIATFIFSMGLALINHSLSSLNSPLHCSYLSHFFFIEINDVYNFIDTGIWVQSIDQFYMILIFADLLFMLVAFRYTLHYPDVFKYAAYVPVTVFIRFSLMAPVYYNALLELFAVLFSIAVAYAHNLFMQQGRLNYITRKNNS